MDLNLNRTRGDHFFNKGMHEPNIISMMNLSSKHPHSYTTQNLLKFLVTKMKPGLPPSLPFSYLNENNFKAVEYKSLSLSEAVKMATFLKGPCIELSLDQYSKFVNVYVVIEEIRQLYSVLGRYTNLPISF